MLPGRAVHPSDGTPPAPGGRGGQCIRPTERCRLPMAGAGSTSGGTLPMVPDPEDQETLLTMPSHISTVMSTSVRMERSWVTTRTSRSFEYSFRIFITLNAFS